MNLSADLARATRESTRGRPNKHVRVTSGPRKLGWAMAQHRGLRFNVSINTYL